MGLPIFQKANDQNFVLMENSWSALINPVLAFPPINGVLLNNVALISGVNVINHLLQRQQQGWILTDVTAGAGIYRSAPFNSTTLTLTSGAACQVNLWVY